MNATVLGVTFLAVITTPIAGFAQTTAETEPNDTPATADTAVLGGQATGRVSHPWYDGTPHEDPDDYWVIRAEAGDTIYVDVDACSWCIDAGIMITLLAADGVTPLAYGENYDESDPVLIHAAISTGLYVVKVRARGYSGHLPYTLRFAPAPACPTDPGEPNNSRAAAAELTPGSTLHGAWCPYGDQDYFRMHLEAGMVLEYSLDGYTAHTYFEHPVGIDILGANGDTLQAVTHQDPNRFEALRFTVPATGTYFLRPWSVRQGLNRPYQLSVSSAGQRPLRPSSLTIDRAARHLLELGAPLDNAERAYLDVIGNRNGRYDIGDFRAFLLDEQAASSAARKTTAVGRAP
jgi:hypothetical protein